jgi:hypothetical protein
MTGAEKNIPREESANHIGGRADAAGGGLRLALGQTKVSDLDAPRSRFEEHLQRAQPRARVRVKRQVGDSLRVISGKTTGPSLSLY